MKRYYLILFVLTINLLIQGCVNTSDKGNKPSSLSDINQKKNPGKIEFSKEIHNFGSIKEGEVVAFSFRFKNVGDLPFHLTKAEPSCDCLTVSFSKLELSGQDAASIEVVFHSEGEWGNQIKTIDIETSNGEKKSLTVGAFVENINFNIDLNSSK